MPEPDELADLAEFHTLGDQSIPTIVLDLADGRTPELVWRNELGGLTFSTGTRHIKWNPVSTGIDLARESSRLRWIAERHPAPRVVELGTDGTDEWMVMDSLPGEHAVGDEWRRRTPEAIKAIAEGLRYMHTIPMSDFPAEWINDAWPNRRPPRLGAAPPVDEPVVVHGDACAPNTLISPEGAWTGNVDFGDLTVGDRWADLAIASMSLDWNFGEGHQRAFFAAYGIEPDPERITYYRSLWDLES